MQCLKVARICPACGTLILRANQRRYVKGRAVCRKCWGRATGRKLK